jgi:hypothetical protein
MPRLRAAALRLPQAGWRESRREVDPHALVNRGRRWYLVAWDRGREDWRSFRIDRLARPASTGVRFAARALPANDPAAFVEQSIVGAPNRYGARLTLRAGAGRDRQPLPGGLGHGDAARRRHLRVPHRRRRSPVDGAARRHARRRLELHEPPELVEHLHVSPGRAAIPRCRGPGLPGRVTLNVTSGAISGTASRPPVNPQS